MDLCRAPFIAASTAGNRTHLDDAGRTRGQQDAPKPRSRISMPLSRWWTGSPTSQVASGKIGAVGFCIGGHLAFRLHSAACATVCTRTGIHDGKLGQEQTPDRGRAKEIRV